MSKPLASIFLIDILLIREIMRSNTAVLCLCLLSSVQLYGCGGGGSGGNNSGTSAPGNLYPNISVRTDNTAMNPASHCYNTNSKFRTDHFIIGSKGSVSDAKMQEIARVAQNTFENDLAQFSWDAWSDLGVSYSKPLEVCVIASEGANGAGNELGFVIGPDRSGSNLDKLVKHELKHTYQARFIGPTGLNDAHVWFAEAVATFLSTNETVNTASLNTFISQTGMTPTQVTHDGLQEGVMMRLSDKSTEYGAYNMALRYLQTQGASVQDFWEVFKTMKLIEKSCKTDHQKAIDNHEMVNPIDEKSTSCTGYANVYSTGATQWNGVIISGSIEDHIAGKSEPGKSKFHAAFDYVMNAHSVTYDGIDDVAAFRSTVMNGM
ncbi:hypothetical protein [Photobacterium sp. J15]|uniref:hypothetical protein n=1 Tax=Photobacterium sp. J15 TaxID=265901 RepID=UPI0012EEBDC3|nr:hypothetical protein [Photobacterium sp. J15]